jgi:hypothetical protein
MNDLREVSDCETLENSFEWRLAQKGREKAKEIF